MHQKRYHKCNTSLFLFIKVAKFHQVITHSFDDDVIKWKHFPRYWPFVRGIHRSPVNSPHKGQWRGALMFSLMCARINSWVNNREAGDLRRYRHHYDVIVMLMTWWHGNAFRCITGRCVGNLLMNSRSQMAKDVERCVFVVVGMNTLLDKQPMIHSNVFINTWYLILLTHATKYIWQAFYKFNVFR